MSERLLMGYCPSCKEYVEATTVQQRWPLVVCGCGWKGGVPDVMNGVVR